MSEEPTRPHDNGAMNLSEVVAELRITNARLQTLEDKFDARARGTQPLTERINQLFVEVAETRHERREMRHETRREMREINRTLRRMNVDLATALRNQDDLEDGRENLEKRVSTPETSRPQQ